jgi:hypothetical protein
MRSFFILMTSEHMRSLKVMTDNNNINPEQQPASEITPQPVEPIAVPEDEALEEETSSGGGFGKTLAIGALALALAFAAFFTLLKANDAPPSPSTEPAPAVEVVPLPAEEEPVKEGASTQGKEAAGAAKEGPAGDAQ